MATYSDQKEPTSFSHDKYSNSGSGSTTQPASSSFVPYSPYEDQPQSSVTAELPAFPSMPSNHAPRLDSGFDSLPNQPGSLNSINQVSLGGLQGTPVGPGYLFNLEGDHDDAYESLQLQSLGDNFLSMGNPFPSMGPYPTMGEFPSLPEHPVIIESPSKNESNPQADDTESVHAIHDTQDSMASVHSNPLPFMPSLLGDTENPSEHSSQIEQHEVQENGTGHNSDEMGAQDHSPMHDDEPVVSPQLPSTLLYNVISQPIEIPLREPVRQQPDLVMERVLTEQNVPSP